jgi:tetratricopeptide (TPR) repeat protein
MESLTLRTPTPAGGVDTLVERALASLHAGRGDVDSFVAEALRVDPDCVAAHCIGASALMLASNHPHRAAAAALATLERLRDHASERERPHERALRAWFAGDLPAALERYAAILERHPLDSLALRMAHALDFRLSLREMMRDRVARVLAYWDESMPQFPHVLEMHAFGLEETGDYAGAQSQARRALALDPDNAAAIHVIAHVLEMQGRAREGIAWLESTRDVWERNAGFAIHVAWHLALFHLEVDQTRETLDIHDRTLRSSTSTSALVDATALLWRLALRGVETGSRWRELAASWRRKPLRGSRAFNLVHAMIAFAGARQWRRGRRVVELLRDDAATRAANRPEDLALAIPFCEALLAFARRDYALAVERIASVRAAAERCGGSIAQCDLIHLTLVEAALRARQAQLARMLAGERAARKPQSLLNRWLFARARALA